ncbi:Mov34/MPN/PAD-1 family protein [Vibrio metoecus]|nr:peptidase [Vibrio cholerae]
MDALFVIKNKSELVFSDEQGNLVVINEEVIDDLLKFRQISSVDKEAGGVLIGERRGNHIVLCAISEPGLGDFRSRFRFERKGKHHQKFVDERFLSSGGTQQYVGEWHTHPEDVPNPSDQDKRSWYKNLSSIYPTTLIIIGREQLWVGKKVGSAIQRLYQVY